MMRPNDKPLGHLSGAKNSNALRRPVGQAGFAEGLLIDGGAVGKGLVQIAHVDDEISMGPASVTEATLRKASKEGHLAAFKTCLGLIGSGAGPLALAAAGGGLAVAAARTPADTLLPLEPVHAL